MWEVGTTSAPVATLVEGGALTKELAGVVCSGRQVSAFYLCESPLP
jgi:hypothetical protein